MSLKSLIQLIILNIIFFIIGGVYFKYFAKEKILVTQTSQLTTTEKTQNLKQENKNNDTSEIIELSDKEKSNQNKNNNLNRDILDLNTVRGEISSKQRSTIFIISEFAEYNSSTLGSKFYQNVVINYEDKQITCENFDINMDTNIAIAYNNVVVTDPKSIMRAGKITLDIETKEIDINPDTDEKSKVKINTKQ